MGQWFHGDSTLPVGKAQVLCVENPYVAVALLSSHLQELIVAGRPGLAQHPGLPVPLADPPPPL